MYIESKKKDFLRIFGLSLGTVVLAIITIFTYEGLASVRFYLPFILIICLLAVLYLLIIVLTKRRYSSIKDGVLQDYVPAHINKKMNMSEIIDAKVDIASYSSKQMYTPIELRKVIKFTDKNGKWYRLLT